MPETRILVTGGAGFVGSAILSALREKHPDWILYSIDLKAPTTPLPKVTYLAGSTTSPAEVASALSESRPVAVIATAGIVPTLGHRYNRKLQSLVYETNINGTVNVLSAARDAGCVRAFVWTSSCCAVTDDMREPYANINESWITAPSNSLIYGESKARAEKLVLEANFNPQPPNPKGPPNGHKAPLPFLTCALRPSVLFGPEDYQLIPSIHACIAKRETPYKIGPGTNLWDVTHVANVADAHVLATENLLSGPRTAAGEAFFIANDEPIPFRDFCREVWKNFGHYPPFEVAIPEAVARAVAGVAHFVGSWLGLPVTLSGGSVGDACAVRYCSGEKARRVLGYRPRIGIEEGIRESCKAYKARLDLAKKSGVSK